MAKSALTQLQDQIEAVRREAYAAGYAAAMQAVRDFAGRPATSTADQPARRGRPPAAAQAAKPAPRQQRAQVATRRRLQRGGNARLIAEILQGMPSGTARPAEIRAALQRDKGIAMAFTSIRHALGQLAARNEVEADGDGKTWRYLGGGS
ncbi:MAG TPA: hypothetical protein VG308_12320 [Stellaceae bacterium]|jgi:hypothetical protein|nr:hypothetical protein [Stellaceae bacterium]